MMRYNLWKAACVACVMLVLLSGCAKDYERLEEAVEAETNSYISFDSDIEGEELMYAEDDEDPIRALDFLASANKNGHDHPSLSLSLTNGKEVPMMLVFKNKASNRSFLARDVSFTYKNGRLFVDNVNLSGATDAVLRDHPTEWYMLVVMGGTYRDGRLVFEPSRSIPARSRGPVSLEAIYMSEQWVQLDLTTKGNGRQQKKHFTIKSVGGKQPRITLKNQCTTIMFRMARNETGKSVQFYGVGLSASDMSFSGNYDLSAQALDVSRPLTFNPTSRSGQQLFRVSGQTPTMAPNSATGTDYIYCVGMPLAPTTHIRFVPYVSSRLERANYADKKDITIRPGAYAGVSDIYITSPQFDHPIEAVYTAEDGEYFYTNGSSSLDEALNSGGTFEEDGVFRTYGLPTIEQMAVIVPSQRDTKTPRQPRKIDAIMDFALKQSWSGTEQIAAWSETPKDYIADFQPGADGIFYATRFNDGSRTAGPYYSAYRYQKIGNKLEIRIRELKTKVTQTTRRRPPLFKPTKVYKYPTIMDIANEDYWNAEPDWNQREYKRVIDQGVYWSKSSVTRTWVVTVNHAMKIFTEWSDDQNAAKPNAAFVSRYKVFADNARRAKNKSKNSVLMTTQRTQRN